MTTRAPKSATGEPAPWLPPEYDLADASALQALVRGEATAEQQQRALNWVMYRAADTYGFHYRQNDRDHAFLSGRAFVGQQITKLLKLNLAKLRKPDTL